MPHIVTENQERSNQVLRMSDTSRGPNTSIAGINDGYQCGRALGEIVCPKRQSCLQ
jgi:hypothetical protein